MRKEINMLVILAIVAAVVVGALFLMGFMRSSASTPGVPNESASPQAILDELKQSGTVAALRVADISEGEGDSVVSGDVVLVHYTGILPDGTVFDSSALHGGQPIAFPIGIGYVIKGWDQGIIGMKTGGKRLLAIPPDLGYGASANGKIPPNSTLVFEVELVARTPASAQGANPSAAVPQ